MSHAWSLHVALAEQEKKLSCGFPESYKHFQIAEMYPVGGNWVFQAGTFLNGGFVKIFCIVLV